MSLKKKMGAAVATAAMGAALIGGGTFALFTGQATNANNNFDGGTVVISDVSGGAAFRTATLISNLAPGDAEPGTIIIKNDGTLDAWVKIDGITTNANANFGDGVGDLFDGPTPVQITTDQDVKLIKAGEQATFNVGYNFPLAAGNDYQNDTGNVTFNVKAVQARNNGDANANGVEDTGENPLFWNENATN